MSNILQDMKNIILEAAKTQTITACENADNGIGNYPTRESLEKQWEENIEVMQSCNMLGLTKEEFIQYILDTVEEYKTKPEVVSEKD